jgi:hypothetical protein
MESERVRCNQCKRVTQARSLWLRPVILAPLEVKIRRIVVQSQPRQLLPRDRISKNPSQK